MLETLCSRAVQEAFNNEITVTEKAASKDRHTRVQAQVFYFLPYVTLERLSASLSLSFTMYRMGVIHVPFKILCRLSEMLL